LNTIPELPGGVETPPIRFFILNAWFTKQFLGSEQQFFTPSRNFGITRDKSSQTFNRLLKKSEKSTFSVAEVIHVITLLGCAENSKNKRACFV
jgi:hypothetical protein